MIGICNGFQALIKSGVFSTISDRTPSMTLTFNACGHFECRWVTLMPSSQKCVWTKGLDELVTCPVAHGEGRFEVSEPFSLLAFKERGQIALTYVHADGLPAEGMYPANPNGSRFDVAGICNLQGNVLGLMPHPENHVHDWQNPRHTRGEAGRNGLKLFENGVEHARQM